MRLSRSSKLLEINRRQGGTLVHLPELTTESQHWLLAMKQMRWTRYPPLIRAASRSSTYTTARTPNVLRMRPRQTRRPPDHWMRATTGLKIGQVLRIRVQQIGLEHRRFPPIHMKLCETGIVTRRMTALPVIGMAAAADANARRKAAAVAASHRILPVPQTTDRSGMIVRERPAIRALEKAAPEWAQVALAAKEAEILPLSS